MELNSADDELSPDIFEYLASLDDAQLMNDFYADPSCCICTFRFLDPIAKGTIYKMMFLKAPLSLSQIMTKWPEAKNKEEAIKFEIQINKLRRLQILHFAERDGKEAL